jgi:hypothetical protein
VKVRADFRRDLAIGQLGDCFNGDNMFPELGVFKTFLQFT